MGVVQGQGDKGPLEGNSSHLIAKKRGEIAHPRNGNRKQTGCSRVLEALETGNIPSVPGFP
jgi:hypothetical protein